MSPEKAERYDAYWYDVGTKKAVGARDVQINEIKKQVYSK